MTVTVNSAPAGTITVQPGDRTPASIVIKNYSVNNITTSEIPEEDNLYFSNARAVAALTAGQSITIDANGRINSSATSSSNYSDSNTYANVSLIGYATTTNVALKANIVDLTTPTYGFRTSNANAIIYTSAGNWIFSTDGNLTVPGNIILNSYSVGYLEAPQNSQNTSYTLTLTDSGKHIYSQNTATQVVTIPTNANVAFNVGTMVSIVLQGSGNVTVSPFSGVTLYLAGNSTSASRTISTYGMATLMKVATNTWFINGSGVS